MEIAMLTGANGVCSKSRTAVMTGHFPARCNINGHFEKDNFKEQHPETLKQLTQMIAEWQKILPKKPGSHLLSNERIQRTH